MGRMYSVVIDQVAVTAAIDLLEALVPSDAVMALHRVIFSQDTEEGDAQDEQLFCTIRRITGSPTSGSGGSTPTPAPLSSGDAASGVTCEVANTTQLTGGTDVTLHAEAFNVRAGWDYFPPPEHRPTFAPSTRCLIELETAPADSITVSMTAIFEEIGG